MRIFENFNQSRGGNHFLLRALALTMSACMLAAALAGCKSTNEPTLTVKPGGSGQSAPTEAPKQSENYHTIEVDGKTYYVLDKEYSGDYQLQKVRFQADRGEEIETYGDTVYYPLKGQPLPEDFRKETVMDKAAYEAYCQRFGLAPAFPDHDGCYAVLACMEDGFDVVYVQVADAAVEGDKLRLYFWEDYHNPQPAEEAVGFVLAVPVPASVTKLEGIGMVSAKEAENLRKYGTTYDPENMVAEKPVIYLYPEVETQVQVKLDYEGQLTCTYPAYRAGWTVTAEPDGTLTDESGMTYNYLYWEGETDTAWDFTKGFCVRGEDTAAFLEDALSRLGLTRREANEFIIYWLPRMEGNAWNLISFQGQNYCDTARFTVSPTPDTVIRVFMAWEKLDAPVEIEPQKLTAPARTGFTVIEWGGSEK